MAILRAGILGRASGKVGGVVGGHWKDKSYIREYVIPANPDTDPQKAQRLLMSLAVSFSKALVGPVFNQYVDKFQKAMSGFNFFISRNIAKFITPVNYTLMTLVEGKLWRSPLTLVTYATDTVTISWNGSSVGNNGAVTDKVYAAVYDKSTGIWYFPAAEVVRAEGSIAVEAVIGLTVGNLTAYLWFAKYSLTSSTLLEMTSFSQATGIA